MKKTLFPYLLLIFFFQSFNSFAQWIPIQTQGVGPVKIIKYKNKLFAATRNGLFSSSDNGFVWDRKSLRWSIKNVWEDGGLLYASVEDISYSKYTASNSTDYISISPNEKICLLKSIDDGNNWLPVKLVPKGTIENLSYSDVSTIDKKAYVAGRYVTFPSKDSSGLLFRNCDDTCSWQSLYQFDIFNQTDFIRIKNKLFLKLYTNNNLFTLARIDKGSYVPLMSNMQNFNLWEKNDTLFLSLNVANSERNIISTDWGQSWATLPITYNLPLLSTITSGWKVRETFYAYLNSLNKTISSTNLIKWDTLSGNQLILYDDGKTMFKLNGSFGLQRSDDSGITWTSNSSGFGEKNMTSSNFYSVENDAENALLITYNTGSETLAGYKSNNGGSTWESNKNTNYWYNAFKLNNKYYRTNPPVIYEYKNSTWDSIGGYFQYYYDNIYDFKAFRDTLYRLAQYGEILQYSIDIGKTWKDFYRARAKITSYYFNESGKYVIYYDNSITCAYTTDNVNWVLYKNFPYSDRYKYFFNNDEVYYSYGYDKGVEKAYGLGKTSKKISDNLIKRGRELIDFIVYKDKVYVATSAKTNTYRFYRGENSLSEIYQSDTSGNKWLKIFEAPDYKRINKILLNKDSLYVQLLEKNMSVYTDTSYMLYKSAISDLHKSNTQGIVYWDKNKNSVYDNGDMVMSDIVVNRKDLFTRTDSTGEFLFFLPSIADTLKPILPKKFMTSVPAYYLTSSNDTARNFAIQAPEYQDLAISIATPSVFRPGFETYTHLTVENRGLRAQNATAKLVLDKKTNFISATPEAIRVGDTLTWDLGLLAIDEVKNIQLKFKTPVTTPLDSFVKLAGFVLPIEQDSAKEDNTDVLFSKVVGSYDPNDKLVEPKSLSPENLTKGAIINYTIRFQNTGTYKASFVAIEDTLGDYFDLGSFRLISSSHPCTYEYKGKGIIRFIFNDINLPDSISNEVGSHGFVKYSIVPKSTLKKGDVILNKAFIYFDYNNPIITPTSKLTISTPTHIWDIPKVTEDIKIYPNPAKEAITLEIGDEQFREGILSIYDLAGRLVFTTSIANQMSVIDVSQLKSGEYICTIKSNDNKVFVNKFVKVE